MTDDPMQRMRADFIADSSETIDKISQSLAALGPGARPSRSQVDRLFRTVHSLKGTSGMFELHDVSALAASLENVLDLVRSGSLEVDDGTLDLLIEAFDELAVLFQQARGEPTRGTCSEVTSKLDRLTQSVSNLLTGDDLGDGQDIGAELPAGLETMLSPKELAAVIRHLGAGGRVYRLTFEFDAGGHIQHEEVVLRRLQKAGEIISVVPPEGESVGRGKRTLSLIYAPLDAGRELSGLAAAYGAAVSDLRASGGVGGEGARLPASRTPSGRQEPPARRSTESAQPLSVKVDIDVLDAMMGTVSELYSVRLDLLGIAKKLPHTDQTRRLRDDLLKLGLILDNRVHALQESIAGVRLVPVSLLFERYRGEVRRLARQSGKKVELEFEGEATLIDRAMLDSLHDPILHIIRNAVDHGIESPADRRGQGKQETGRILLRARQEASHICIEVEDDGRGVDCGRVRQKAIEKGIRLAGTAQPLSLIFEPGMSTRADVSDISGRGVGLDAAKTKIDSLKGMITASSAPRQGTRFSVYVPLTLAISRGVLLEENGLAAVVPLASVIEIIAPGKDLVPQMKHSGTVLYRGSRVKASLLSEMLRVCEGREARSVVILGIGDKRRALVAQRVTGETEIVSRPFPEAIVAPGFISGATELQDGRPAIIIQPEGLLREHPVGPASGRDVSDRLLQDSKGAGHTSGESARLLIFRNGDTTYGIGLELLKEVVLLKPVSKVPVLGDLWEGVFFHRGMCHGLLRLAGGDPRGRDARSAAILVSPERCGIGVDEICGHFEAPLTDIESTSRDGGAGLLATCGKVCWEGRDVKIIGLHTGRRGKHADTLSGAGEKR